MITAHVHAVVFSRSYIRTFRWIRIILALSFLPSSHVYLVTNTPVPVDTPTHNTIKLCPAEEEDDEDDDEDEDVGPADACAPAWRARFSFSPLSPLSAGRRRRPLRPRAVG